MTTRDEAVEALRAGQSAPAGAPNPYSDDQGLLRRIWYRGHATALELAVATSPARQAFLQSKTDSG